MRNASHLSDAGKSAKVSFFLRQGTTAVRPFYSESAVAAGAGRGRAEFGWTADPPQPAKSAQSGDPGKGGCPYAILDGLRRSRQPPINASARLLRHETEPKF